MSPRFAQRWESKTMAKKTEHVAKNFDSQEDFLNWLRDTPQKWTRLCNSYNSQAHRTKDFSGTHNYAEADKLARYGWKEGREKMDKALSEAARTISMQAPPTQWLDVGGSFPLVPAAVAGDPMNMINIGDNQRAQRPVIRFLVNLSTSAAVTTETMTTRGAAILSWIDALENADLRCELTLCSGSKDYDGNVFDLSIIVKRAQEPLDIDRIAYALVHPSMFRRQIFAAIERTPFQNSMEHTYGTPADIEPETDQIYFKRMFSGNDHWNNPQTAAAYVKKQIEAGGIRLDEPEREAA